MFNGVNGIYIKMITKNPSTGLKPKTVLLVEDHRYSLIVLKKMLEMAGINVIPVENGIEAVREFNENPSIDLVLMDIKMPFMDGYAAMQEIKKLNPEVKVIAETAYGLTKDKEMIMDAGFDGYLPKPITRESLQEILDLHL
jgi:CheY-like chemotaxis protein